MTLRHFLATTKSVLTNVLPDSHSLIYIIEPSNWSITMDGEQLVQALNTQDLIQARVGSSVYGLRNKIIHFGSINTIISRSGIVRCHKSNIIILTWFHVLNNDPRQPYIKELVANVDLFHTASNETKKRLVEMGVPSSRIVVIPLGVNTKIFQPVNEEKRAVLRNELNIPTGKFIIGSFQKDGVGWGLGDEPKLIKGPDIFCEVVERLSKNINIHILLTGPARGYVMNRLSKAGVAYTHSYLKNYIDIVKYYQALDVYLVTSRIEGGPKAILEAWAAGTPVITTRVGMVNDICTNQENAMISDVGDVDSLCHNIQSVLQEQAKGQALRRNGIAIVSKFDWSVIADRYFASMYQQSLKKRVKVS